MNWLRLMGWPVVALREVRLKLLVLKNLESWLLFAWALELRSR